jgi:hypothetical protein
MSLEEGGMTHRISLKANAGHLQEGKYQIILALEMHNYYMT